MLTGCLIKVSGLSLMTIPWSSPLGSLRNRVPIKKRFVIIMGKRSDSLKTLLYGLNLFTSLGIEVINFRVRKGDNLLELHL